MLQVALVIDLIEGELLFVIFQLRRDVIGCKDCKKLFVFFHFCK